ncbi:MAG TPA: efflux RND transporter periplasmic adaptor subunit [Bacteroidia bacterium]|nr:efflux RND transporter periplasmic adaptor subunit [Bacteroidia bacterium]
MKNFIYFCIIALTFGCQSKVEKTKVLESSITESVYASGMLKSKNQYQVFAGVNGILNEVLVAEGDTVKMGDLLFRLVDDAAMLSKENAALNAQFAELKANSGKLNEAKLFLELSSNKMKNDSLLYFRQKNLWQQQVGTKVDLEQKELNYMNAKTNYYSAKVKYDELLRQLELNATISQKNLAISSKMQSDFSIKSEIDGIVYSINKNKGEIVSSQAPIAVIGDAKQFILEMQVDEYDILKIKKGLPVIVTLDSYKGKSFDAVVTKINPLMNERNKTFMIEAEFVNPPELLYPNTSFEANILLRAKNKALLIPRNCLINDSIVIMRNGDSIKVKTGLKDYQKIEIIDGLKVGDEIIIPKQ